MNKSYITVAAVALFVVGVGCDAAPTKPSPQIEGAYLLADITTDNGEWWPVVASSLTIKDGAFEWSITGRPFASGGTVTLDDHGTYRASEDGMSAELRSDVYGWTTTATVVGDSLLRHRYEHWRHNHVWRRK